MTPNQKEQFEAWWEREGSTIAPVPMETALELDKRTHEIAWSNGIYKMGAQDKIRVAVSVCGVEYVHRSLTGFLKSIGKLGLANDYEIQEDGSILNVWDCNHLTETELEEFVSWAERENA